VRRYDHAPGAEFYPSYVRGQAYLRLNDGQAAALEFRRILDHRGEVPVTAIYPLAHIGLARALVMTGDTAAARKAYEDFFALWSGADADLPPLRAARQEFARLP
jgi:hypothetical protein